MNLEKWRRDSTYDNRKVLNSEDVINCAQQMGVKLDEIGELCGVSKTMVSHWKNPNRPDRPTRKQIDPLLNKYGRGRFELVLEPLSPAAREYDKLSQWLVSGVFLAFIFYGVWWLMIRPCVAEWDECQKLAWYQLPSYQMRKNDKLIEEFREFLEERNEQLEASSDQ